ncbi:MAG: ECF transporter S component [Eubacteriales bacterium]|nr:ECF transporter S component [Eubacteriales bacterium]
MKTNTKTSKVVGLGLFTAIVVVLQLLGSFIKFGPFSITLVLAPIVIGAALYGIGAGAYLGLVFGATVLISGDAAAFLTINPIGTVIIVLLKGMLAGLAAGLVYSLISKASSLAGVIVAGVVCPIVNTGIFLAGCYIFFQEWLVAVFGTTGFVTVVAGLVGVNFLIELGINMVLSTAIVKIIDLGKKQLNSKTKA